MGEGREFLRFALGTGGTSMIEQGLEEVRPLTSERRNEVRAVRQWQVLLATVDSRGSGPATCH